MLAIKRFTVNDMIAECVTDQKQPVFSFALESDQQDVVLEVATLKMGNWQRKVNTQIGIKYNGPELVPFTEYKVLLEVKDNHGETATASLTFETGRLGTPFQAKWITNGSYHFTERKTSPKPMHFKRQFSCQKEVVKARLYTTALGIYEAKLNGEKIGADYFAPGFTSYKNQLQYQTYNVTDQLKKSNELFFTVAGGWAVGAFTYARRNRVYAKRQALFCELHIEFEDGSKEIIASDETFSVTMNGHIKEAEFYNGEVYDATVNMDDSHWEKATLEQVKIKPEILAQYGLPVRAKEEFRPVAHHKAKSGMWIYDFGQNFAGVITAKIKGEKGQKITFKHAEILMEGELFTEPLRSAKQESVYICEEGQQTYSPTMTYMGFRYVGVTGIDPKDLELTARALYSNVDETGYFECSNDLLNQLQSNIKWGTKSNFVDIPTDCPQRDERMGWTGDIALFASTASFNFNTRRFYDKWLLDVQKEQNRGGGIPVTVPLVRVPFQWEIMIPMAVDHWGDACILVPWAEYLTRGDVSLLKQMYPTMKKYVKACKFWAELFSVGKHRRIWRLLHHYGDWVAPEGGLWTWMGRGKWTATASLANTTNLLAQIAEILEKPDDAKYYKKLSEETSEAYRSLLMDKDCRVKKEFQTAYVLPLHYKMLNRGDASKAASHLARMIKENSYHIGTGFPGTPYVLFALADNGYIDEAYKMLLTDTRPSWLFQIKAGATTIWERWDALREDGTSNTGADDGTNGMVSFNHFANGAVGDFMYRRIAGIEPIEGGYKTFKIEPILGGGLTYAKAEVETAYGKVKSHWTLKDDEFSIDIHVPVGTTCNLTLPNGKSYVVTSGHYQFHEDREVIENEC